MRTKAVDTHTHAWGPNTDARPWAGTDLPPRWTGAYTHDDLVEAMNNAGVDEAIVVTPPLYGREQGANDYTLESIEAHPSRLWGVGTMGFFDDNASERMRNLTAHKRILGVRLHVALSYDPVPAEMDREATWITDDRLDPIWDAAATDEIALFVFPKAQQLRMLTTVLEAHPDLTMIIDHMAWPDETTTADEPPWTHLRELAAYPHTAVKLSSLPRSADESWPYTDLHPYVRRLVEWFGPSCLMLGSDYPWMSSWAAYDQCLSWLDECEGLSTNDRASIRYRTFERLFE